MKTKKYLLSEARKIEPDFEVGEDVSEEVKLVDLGRRTVLIFKTKPCFQNS
jgi:N utilization substance protein A